jgi:hypothetical protein
MLVRKYRIDVTGFLKYGEEVSYSLQVLRGDMCSAIGQNELQ